MGGYKGQELSDEYGISPRDRKIFEDYISGKVQREIAEEHGISQPMVSKIVRAVATKLPPETIEEARNIDLARVEQMAKISMNRYQSGDVAEGRLLLDLVNRRAKVFGYEAPKEIHVEGHTKYEIVGVDVKDV